MNQAVTATTTTLYGTGGARTLARVLLHAYNVEQPFDITDFCVLDSKYEECVWAILKLRVDGIEPQQVVEDKVAFQSIVDKYWIKTED